MPDVLAEVRAAVAERRHAESRYRASLQTARDAGVSMAELADAAGVSRQGVFKVTSTPVGKRRKRREYV